MPEVILSLGACHHVEPSPNWVLQSIGTSFTCFADLVLHAGGVLEDALIEKQTLASMRHVWGPKVSAAEGVKAQLWAAPVVKSVFFSSTAAIFGPPGQANYAAANAALNASAQIWHAGGEDGRHGTTKRLCFSGPVLRTTDCFDAEDSPA